MDSGLEERILPSIRRSQILLIHRNGGVDNPETCGQIACSVRLSEGWRPAVKSRARSGDYLSVSRWAQAARSGQTQGSAPTTIFAINFPDVLMYGEIEGILDSGQEEGILPSIRRP